MKTLSLCLTLSILAAIAPLDLSAEEPAPSPKVEETALPVSPPLPAPESPGILDKVLEMHKEHMNHMMQMMDPNQPRSPSLAVGLSLIPWPADLGNLYAGSWEAGLFFTAAEVGLFVPTMVYLSKNFQVHEYRGMDQYGQTARWESKRWTASEEQTFYWLLGGYLATKVVSAFYAGHSAEEHNREISTPSAMKSSYDALIPNVSVTLAGNLQPSPILMGSWDFYDN